MTPGPSLVGLFVAPLNRARIAYMVSGGYAAIVYGHPRLTVDMDIVLRLGAGDAPRFAALWPAAEFYCPPVEVIANEASRAEHGHFNIIHNATALRADVYLSGASELQQWALERRVVHRIDGEDVQIAPVEYVIAFKLSYVSQGGSDRHLRDIARMIEVRGPEIDQNALDGWIGTLGLAAEWARARSLVGKE